MGSGSQQLLQVLDALVLLVTYLLFEFLDKLLAHPLVVLVPVAAPGLLLPDQSRVDEEAEAEHVEDHGGQVRVVGQVHHAAMGHYLVQGMMTMY